MSVQKVTVLRSCFGQWEGLGRRVNCASARYRATAPSVSAHYTLSHFQRGSFFLKAVIYFDPESCQASAQGLHTVQMSFVFRNSNKDTRTHALTHARTHTRTHAHMHALMHTCTHARTHAHTHACTHTRMHAHISTTNRPSHSERCVLSRKKYSSQCTVSWLWSLVIKTDTTSHVWTISLRHTYTCMHANIKTFPIFLNPPTVWHLTWPCSVWPTSTEGGEISLKLRGTDHGVMLSSY